MRFRDRTDAGRRLAVEVQALGLWDPLVLALPRGGVPVAAEVARALGAPLEVLVARKVGAPGRPELGMGAIAEGGGLVVNRDVRRALQVHDDQFAEVLEREMDELQRRVAAYRGGCPLPPLTDREVVVVDDGLATGATAEAALQSVRTKRPSRLVLAVPVGSPATVAALRRRADDVVCLEVPARFEAVGSWYDDFAQTTDAEVLGALARD